MSHLFRATWIAAKSVGQIHKWSLPPAHDALEGRLVACQNPFRVGLILGGAHTQFDSLFVRLTYIKRGCVILFSVSF